MWIALLLQNNVVDYLLCISAGKKLILDAEEMFPMRITIESLRMCGEPKATEMRVAKVLQLIASK